MGDFGKEMQIVIRIKYLISEREIIILRFSSSKGKIGMKRGGVSQPNGNLMKNEKKDSVR